MLSTTRRGSAVVAALNGLIGDRLERSGSALPPPAWVPVDGEAVALDAGSVTAAFPDATSRLVVFLHGLMGNEFSWDWGGAQQAIPTARDWPGISVAPPYTCDTTPGSTSLRTVCPLRRASRSWWEFIAGERSKRSRLWVARWAVWWRERLSPGLRERTAAGRARPACGLTGHAAPGRAARAGARVAAEALYALPETRMFGAFLRRRSARHS